MTPEQTKPHCATCGKTVAEVLCPECGKWWADNQPPVSDDLVERVERAVSVCPQCEGEGSYADGLDEAACTTTCTRCDGNGWIADARAIIPIIQADEREACAKVAEKIGAEEDRNDHRRAAGAYKVSTAIRERNVNV